ncbi:hypothetical protein HSB1_31890 [Halogranum salarium B-1]|uniref:Uncharacterized protein n=1 Tax=Halogranum salarium B-1 TaxID=1210908 RepID=J3JEW1_9EURY|nr:hypothetical protein HSB1_31890 [Halogranum salarium B-1]
MGNCSANSANCSRRSRFSALRTVTTISLFRSTDSSATPSSRQRVREDGHQETERVDSGTGYRRRSVVHYSHVW